METGIALILLALSIAAYSISQLQQHGKLSFMGHSSSFWGVNSWVRKYSNKEKREFNFRFEGEPSPHNWYYRFFKIKYKERFLFSTTFLIAFTDGYHCFQALFFSFLSLSFAVALGFNWWLFTGLFIGIRLAHFLFRKTLSK